jgi:CheY-like chemotaxis protein
MRAALNSPLSSRCRSRLDEHCLEASPAKIVLAVDDNQDDIFLLGLALSPVIGDCRVLTAADGVEAEDLLRSLEDQEEAALPSVIFTDINMPRQNGFQLLEWVKQRPRCAHIPVVMVSTFDDPADMEKARALGAVACLRKPPPPQEAQRLLASLMCRGHGKNRRISSAVLPNAQPAKIIHFEEGSAACTKP